MAKTIRDLVRSLPDQSHKHTKLDREAEPNPVVPEKPKVVASVDSLGRCEGPGCEEVVEWSGRGRRKRFCSAKCQKAASRERLE